MPKILVVDDSAVDRLLLEGMLSKVEGYTVVQAGDGKEGLEKIKEWQVDLVVTDLQMPEMDGLELVKVMRVDYPSVPAILVTGVGSEEIATEALAAGAASYLPKSKAAELLVPTVKNVFEMMFVEHSFARLLTKATQTRFEFSLNNEEVFFPAIVELCVKMLEGMSPLDQIERLRIGIAIEQALSNALYRGNLEIASHHQVQGNKRDTVEFAELVHEQQETFKKRKIYVCLDIKKDEFDCLIRDQGPGFKPDNLTEIDGNAGRGLILMQTFMDEVNFNRIGNEVRLRRIWNRKPGESQPAQVQADDLLQLGSINLGVFRCNETGLAIELVDPMQLVGRASTCHIVLKDTGVDRHHCQLMYRNGLWSFKAINQCAVSVNGKQATHGTIMPGDKIQLGTREYQIQYDAAI